MNKLVKADEPEKVVTVGGQKWAVKEEVTLPILPHDHRRNPVVAIEFQSGFVTEDVTTEAGEIKQITSARVIDLETGRQCRYCLNKMSLRALIRYAGGDDKILIGRKFVINKLLPPAGKRWCEIQIVEIEEKS